MSVSLFVGGIDEAGRGPLAGPVVAAAVVLPAKYQNEKITDSKKVAERDRERLFIEITKHALSYAIEQVGPEEIDSINIREATRQAMARAAERVSAQLLKSRGPHIPYFLIDGNMTIPTAQLHEHVVKGDQKLLSVAAASILAKVFRDRLMFELDQRYPGYGLAKHKGYPTKYHREQIKLLGPTIIHRRTFAGVREYLPLASDTA